MSGQNKQSRSVDLDRLAGQEQHAVVQHRAAHAHLPFFEVLALGNISDED